MKSLVWEQDDKLYIVSPVSPFDPDDTEIEEFAFAEQLKSLAPNDNIKWLRGQYVEADNPNSNGQMWTAGELQIKALTPMLMPVTVMHDPRTAVGTIADARLLVPDKDSVPRARIDTSLAIWRHRFPEVIEEAQHNYEQGSLMQSMECVSPHYSCGECGKVFQKLPDGAERTNWCSHLQEAGSAGTRILGNVVFTGTGLIFGTRGAKGAFDQAHLEVFQEEVAAAHYETHRDRRKRTGTKKRKTTRRNRSMDPIEISREEYAELQKRPSKDDFDALTKRAETAESERDAAVTAKEAAEIAQKKAEDEAKDLKTKVDEAEEASNQAKLSGDRMEKLGNKFLAKLPDSIKGRLPEEAKSLTDEKWEERLTELSELVEVKPDESDEAAEGKKGGGEGGKDGEFSREEVARSTVGGGSGGNGDGNGSGQSDSERQSVVAGLMSKPSQEKK